jgi:hypothetical protein
MRINQLFAHGYIRRPLSKALVAVLLLVALSLTGHRLFAAATDIVADDSIIRDSLGRLAADGVLAANASDLLQDRVLTRAEAARLIEQGLGLQGATMQATLKSADVSAARAALISLRPELSSDHIDVDAIVKTLPASSLSYLGVVQPEARIDTGGHDNKAGSGAIGIYRGTVLGDLGTHTQYGLSLSNQAQDDRRVFDNDTGTHDYSALTQAYLQFNGTRGLNFLIGRTDDNWGAGAQGGTLLSDNGSPLDQLRVAFPFSMGQHLGRNWNYTQLASTYDKSGTRTYLQARRIEINFSTKWSAQYEEALESTSSSLLLRAPLPFLTAKGINLSSAEGDSEFIANTGLQYQANREFRTYGQLLINDIKSPFRGHIAGFSVGTGTQTPQRLAYLIGASLQTPSGTSATVEYSIANPTTYLDAHPDLNWTEGAYDYLGLPEGANFKQIYALISQKVTSKTTLYIEGRSRQRFSSSYPAPNSQDFAASAKYQFDKKNSVSLTYHDYFQDAYPIAPGAPGYPSGDGFISPSNANPGSSTVIHELDAAYTLAF